jgi:hypothetical protein
MDCIICQVNLLGSVEGYQVDICSKCIFKYVSNRMKLINILENYEFNSGFCEVCLFTSSITQCYLCYDHQ